MYKYQKLVYKYSPVDSDVISFKLIYLFIYLYHLAYQILHHSSIINNKCFIQHFQKKYTSLVIKKEANKKWILSDFLKVIWSRTIYFGRCRNSWSKTIIWRYWQGSRGLICSLIVRSIDLSSCSNLLTTIDWWNEHSAKRINHHLI